MTGTAPKPWTWAPVTPKIGDVVTMPNPLTRWDRFRIWLGLRRKSPATGQMVCVAGHVSAPLPPRWEVRDVAPYAMQTVEAAKRGET
ncbi:hypothetical protein SSBR45G_46750 [Bradyrhizobium sp. SSBR45G]|nr:hypothetical protein SSBR45G_46750 [Bradyrhizobium sp. SSBR45G]GLH87116.1 hypothetical protein SSBR45R_45760 [Bradyrhizobium sp. SSBR45R]